MPKKPSKPIKVAKTSKPVKIAKPSKVVKTTKPEKSIKPKVELFQKKNLKKIEQGIIKLINAKKNGVTANTINSPRIVGDSIQDLLEKNFETILPEKYSKNVESDFGRKSMADLVFGDSEGHIFYVDVKTHNLETEFNMPNLTSAYRLAEFYESDQNYFMILLVTYQIKGKKIEATTCKFIPIECIDWSCLRIGALGRGQIQLENSNNLVVKESSRKKWMMTLCDVLNEFYNDEIEKITNERIHHFQEVKKFWKKKN